MGFFCSGSRFPAAAVHFGAPCDCPRIPRRYHRDMARGWESKSVEEQVEQQQSSQPSPDGNASPEVAAARAARQRERQALELQRERILDERTSNPIRRKALETALTEIEAKLAAL